MKRFLFSVVFIFVFIFGFFVFPQFQQASAACTANGRGCLSDANCCSNKCQTSSTGSRVRICVDSGPPPVCKCDFPGEAESGRNGFKCTHANGDVDPYYCWDVGKACYDDNKSAILITSTIKRVQGIECLEPSVKKKPETAKPPCNSYGADDKCLAVDTSFGSFSTDPGQFIVRVFLILLGACGSIALILIMRSGYKIMSARGNPEGIKEGREQLVAAIVGLMFLIFSFVLLEVITVNILKIPGF